MTRTMPIQNQVESILHDELHAALPALRHQIDDCDAFLVLAKIICDAAMIPIRVARDDDSVALLRPIGEMAREHSVAHRVRAQEIVTQVWTRTVARMVGPAIMGDA